MTMQTDAQKYFNESIGRKVEESLKVEVSSPGYWLLVTSYKFS